MGIEHYTINNTALRFGLEYETSPFKPYISSTSSFTFGVGYLGSIIGYDKALIVGLYPFIPSEFFKIALALFLIPTIWKYANR